MPKKENAPTFESALERIEQIAARMEAGDLPLEDLIVAYEEGLRLIRFCGERLDEAEKRLQTITRDAAGHPQGIAPIPEEIPSSTPPATSATKQDSGDSGGASAPVRLF
jgi:exodeoxyribonuclease VII small subunit